MRKKIIHIAGISFLTVLLGIAVSLCGGLVLENRFGLNLLFRLRGSVQPPPEILIVSLGRYMAPGADVTGPQEKWPRSSYAELIENLAAKKASTICIDVNFKNTGDEKEDLMLSRAMKKAGNVILHEDVQIVRVRDQTGNITNLYKRKRSPTIPVLARSAAGCAPFFLPKKPHQVSRYWTFKPDLDDNPTLPVILYYFYTRQVHEAFYGLLESLPPDVGQIPPHDVGNDTHGEKIKSHIKMIRNLFKNNPNIFHKLSDKLRKGPSDTGDVQKKMLESLAGLFRGEYRYLNFYGPPGTITTISRPQALKKKIKTGAVVFIGLSELFTSKQKDSFITVFSRSDGVDLSGVEILATAFSNILENSHIQSLPMGKHFLFVVAWGAATGLICRIFSTSGSAFSLIGLSTLWTVLSFYRFKYAFVWYPLVIPICIQAPFAFFSSVLWKNFEIKRERRKIRKAFGYYIPDHLVDHLVENVSDIRNSNQSVHGVCMFTDARHFTSLSETVTPMELSRLMNQYYEAVSRPIARHGGILSRIVGDGMLVVWAALSPDQNPCTKSCLAALDIIRAVDRLHSVANAPRLPTRIGIHSGHFFYGNIGSKEHYDYTPMGDAVNTASRLESLNKKLGTWILASEDVVGCVDDILKRKMGKFLFSGKTKPVVVYELLKQKEKTFEQDEQLCAAFEKAVLFFEQRSWDKAASLFHTCLNLKENDGPSLFYLKVCRDYKSIPPGQKWDGTIKVGK